VAGGGVEQVLPVRGCDLVRDGGVIEHAFSVTDRALIPYSFRLG
jgi:hypothetical protein